MEINIPANALYFFALLMDIANFNVIPINNQDDSFFAFEEFDQEPYNNYFMSMGYDSMNGIINMGILFHTCIIMTLITVFFYGLQLFLPPTEKKTDGR